MRGIPKERFHALETDGRKLQFPDNYFTKIFSISVLEHIPDDGDTQCMKEIARTLMQKGVCVLTVPFSPIGRDEFREPEEFRWSEQSKENGARHRVFFQRRYSEKDLRERLIGPSGLMLQGLCFVGERIPLAEGKEVASYLHPVTGMIHPLMSTLFHTKPTTSWQELRKPLAAVVVMTKQ
jgi:ubiquinone/menaquinone biosynthesis C-methylase UbiE